MDQCIKVSTEPDQIIDTTKASELPYQTPSPCSEGKTALVGHNTIDQLFLVNKPNSFTYKGRSQKGAGHCVTTHENQELYT